MWKYLIAVSLVIGNVQAFDITKKQPKINFLTIPTPACKAATLPPVIADTRANTYYQAARKIAGQGDGAHYSQMLILGRKAADLGHWPAKLFMAEQYMEKSGRRFNAKQARIFLDELMQQGVPGAFYLMSQARNQGGPDFDNAPSPASAYLYESARLGDPRGLVAVANIFSIVKRHREAAQLIECGIQLGAGIAASDKARSISINAGTNIDSWHEVFRLEFLAAKAGDPDGLHGFSFQNRYFKMKYNRSFMSEEYEKRMNDIWIMTRQGFWHDDPYRKSKGLPHRVKGRNDYKLPNLAKVVPFPPTATLPTWNGDFSVLLSDEDALIYRTDYNYERLIKEIHIDGLL